MSAPTTAVRTTPKRLSSLDKWLPLWIGLAMVAGILLGRFVPALSEALSRLEVGGISVPIGLGLLVMMYPVLAKVRYDKIAAVTGDKRLLVSSLLLNWIVGPAVMFALAWIFLPDLPEYRTGLIIVGLARCIAMVVIWNDLACGDREATAVLVAINSVFQVFAFSLLGWFYLTVLPGWLGLDSQGLDVSVLQIALNVLVFLGIPLVAGFASRWIGEKRKGRDWYEEKFLPVIGPTSARDLLGWVLDKSFLPSVAGTPFNKSYFALSTGVVKSLDDRIELDDKFKEFHATGDPYVAEREWYLAKRHDEIEALHGRGPLADAKKKPEAKAAAGS